MTTAPHESAPSELGAALDALSAGRARTGWARVDASAIPLLTTAEAALIERAVPRRRAEFATGRTLLRSLMGRDVEILRTVSGRPQLPDDVIASLAHDREIAVAVVAPAREIRAAGVDVEPVHELDPRVAELIVRPDDVTPDPLTAFVAKEAAYKAWSGLGGDLLEHHDVRVVVESGRYRADLRGELVVEGDLAWAAGRVLALVLIPAS